ncbi:Uncharacterized oxidoreductase MexAM1_META1p0182 (fragment) [Paraburkholderia piptadeniae]|uniref:Uncharacterized oxidoreductase MexAM1_META1p0182 n=1 Tax=Paraburkholderia piptadeniae TaxID=1701573 RepID=A0A1N7SIY4_9BURK
MFITGASRGLGALIVQAALADGNAVVAAGRKVAAIDERLGKSPALLRVALDVTDEAQAKAAVVAAVEKFGRIDVLVNNAAFGLLAALEESGDANVRRAIDAESRGRAIAADRRHVRRIQEVSPEVPRLDVARRRQRDHRRL